MTTSSTAAEAAASDPGSARAAWRLRLAEELAEVGMELVRDLRRQSAQAVEAEAAEAEAARRPAGVDPGLAFTRLSRAVRLTLMLHEQFDQACAARAAELEADAARRAASAKEARDRREMAVAFRLMTVESFVKDAIEARLDRGERLDVEGLLDRLDHEVGEIGEAELLALPPGELVERICNQLGLAFDWNALSDEQLVELDIEPARIRLCARGQPAPRQGEAMGCRPVAVGSGPPHAPP